MKPFAPIVVVLSCAGLVACGAAERAETTAVFQAMTLEQDDDGVSHGFDLDGFVSDARDGRGCRQVDFQAPDGTPGIDNQLGGLLPLLDIVGEGALAAFIQNAIDEGRLLVIPQMIDSGEGKVDLTILRGADLPLLGTDGKLLPEQTLELSSEKQVLGTFESADYDGSVLTAGPFDLNLPIVVFDLLYDVYLHDAYFEIRFDDDGVGRGVLAGATTIQDLKEMADTAGSRAGFDILELLDGVLEDVADMQRDETGTCGALSVVATFETVPAYLYVE